ncbi:MAG: T9SS type A sorting domain-containing protein [Bacteroidota bacterium]
MKTFYLFLFAAAFALAGTSATAQTGTFCFVDNFNYQWEIVVNNNATDLIVGTIDNVYAAGGVVAGGRGQSNTTIRHHVLTAINLDASQGGTDWFVYNGNVAGGSFPFTYSGDWVSSAGTTGGFTGSLTSGPCPLARPGEPVPNGPATAGMTEASRLEAAATAEALGVSVYPNPTPDEARISYTLDEATDVRLVIYDMRGRQIATLAEGTQEAGVHTATFDARDLASGVYVWQLRAGTQLTSGQLSLTR